MSKPVIVSGVQCPHCLNIIVSRARHDFHYCQCECAGIDGGTDYTRVAFKDIPPKTVKVQLARSLSLRDLYVDWNYRHDKFGTAKVKYPVDPAKYTYVYSADGRIRRYRK